MTRLVAPNTCQVPNAFFDVLLPELGDAELRVVLYLIRQSFGWQREWTEKGYGRIDQICRGSGLSRQGAINALKSLRVRNLIESRKSGVAFEYRVRVHAVYTSTDQAEPVNVVDRPHVQSTSLTDGGQPGGPDPVNVVDREPVNDVDRIKRQSSKPNENPEEGAAEEARDARSAAAADDAELSLAGAVALVAFGHADATVPTKHVVEYDKAVRLLDQGGYSADDVLDADDYWRRAYERRHDRQPTSARVTQVVQHCAEWRLATQPAGPLFDREAHGVPLDDDAVDRGVLPLPAHDHAPPTAAAELWAEVLAGLRIHMVAAAWERWCKPTRALGFDDDETLLVEVPTPSHRDWLSVRLDAVIAEALQDARRDGFGDAGVRYVVAGEDVAAVAAEREAVVA